VLLKNVKGLGLKTAQKIIVEISGKMVELGAEVKVQAADPIANNEVYNETIAALVMLGFQKSASDKVVKALLKENPSVQVEEAVRLALRRL
jgi:Holliday junction DNA helicase RuvA